MEAQDQAVTMDTSHVATPPAPPAVAGGQDAAAAERVKRYREMRSTVAADTRNAESAIGTAMRRRSMAETRGRVGRAVIVSRFKNGKGTLLFTLLLVTELKDEHPLDNELGFVLNTFKPIKVSSNAKNTWVPVHGGDGELGAYIRVPYGACYMLREPIGKERMPEAIPVNTVAEFSAARWCIETFQKDVEGGGKQQAYMFRFAAMLTPTQIDLSDYLASLPVNYASPLTAAQRFRDSTKWATERIVPPNDDIKHHQTSLSLPQQVREVSTVTSVDVAAGMRDFAVGVLFAVEPAHVIERKLAKNERVCAAAFEPTIDDTPERTGYVFTQDATKPKQRCVSGTSVAYTRERIQPVKFTFTSYMPGVDEKQHDVCFGAPLYAESVEPYQLPTVAGWGVYGPTLIPYGGFGACAAVVGKTIADDDAEGDGGVAQHEILMEYVEGVIACGAMTFTPSLDRCVKAVGMLYDSNKLEEYYRNARMLEFDVDANNMPVANGNLRPVELEVSNSERTAGLCDTFHRPGEKACNPECVRRVNITRLKDFLKRGQAKLYIVCPWRAIVDPESGAIIDMPDIERINSLPTLAEREAAYMDPKWYKHLTGRPPQTLYVVSDNIPVAGMFGTRVQ